MPPAKSCIDSIKRAMASSMSSPSGNCKPSSSSFMASMMNARNSSSSLNPPLVSVSPPAPRFFAAFAANSLASAANASSPCSSTNALTFGGAVNDDSSNLKPSGNVPFGNKNFGNGNGGIASSSSVDIPLVSAATSSPPNLSSNNALNASTYSSTSTSYVHRNASVSHSK